MKECLICRRPDISVQSRVNGFDHNFDCQRCGNYTVERQFMIEVLQSNALIKPQQIALSFHIRSATDEEERLRTTIGYENYELMIAAFSPFDALEQADRFVDLIAARSSGYGALTDAEHAETWAARLGMGAAEPLVRLHRELLAQGFIREPERELDVTKMRFALTLVGWKQARLIRAARGPGNQAFVAMWFHEQMDRIFDEGYLPALRDVGYVPYRVDREHHNNRIDDEIIAQIRRSKILVADATGARASVYYEAGFAYGLALPVIWCCNSSYRSHVPKPSAPNMPGSRPPGFRKQGWFDTVAFDTSHHNFILWNEPSDLQDKLVARIRGLALDLPVR